MMGALYKVHSEFIRWWPRINNWVRDRWTVLIIRLTESQYLACWVFLARTNTRLKMNIREPLEIQYMLLTLNLSIHILLVLITLFFFFKPKYRSYNENKMTASFYNCTFFWSLLASKLSTVQSYHFLCTVKKSPRTPIFVYIQFTHKRKMQQLKTQERKKSLPQ